MDEQQLAQLRDWAGRLRRDGDSDELKAAGRALELATEEIARLKAQLNPKPQARAGRRLDQARPRAGTRSGATRGRRSTRVRRRRGRRRPGLGAAPPRSQRRAHERRRHRGARPPAHPAGARRRHRPRRARAACRGRSRGAQAAPPAASPAAPGPPAPGPRHADRGRRRRTGARRRLRGDPHRRARRSPRAARRPTRRSAPSRKQALEVRRSGRADARSTAPSWVLDGQDVRSRVRRANGVATLSGRSIGDGEHWLTVRADGRLPGARTTAQVALHDRHDAAHGAPRPEDGQGARRAADELRRHRPRGRHGHGRRSSRSGEGRPLLAAAERAARRRPSTSRSPTSSATRASARSRSRSSRARRGRRCGPSTSPPTPGRTRRSAAACSQLIDQGRINTVELDLKDESGEIGFERARSRSARQVGAVKDIYDLPQALDTLHRKGVMVVGRIVAFRDPIYATGAWQRGWRSQVIQTPDGQPYSRLRRLHELRQPGRAPLQRRHRARRRRRPASTTSSTTTSAGRTGRSRR